MEGIMWSKRFLYPIAIIILLPACTPTAPATPTQTPTPLPTNTAVPPTASPTITETPTPTYTITPDRPATKAATTSTAIAKMTETAQPMADTIQKLYDEGYLASTDGTYFQLADFDESWAQIRYYQWWLTDYAPQEFVISADAQWWSASDNANWYLSGCGFVFRVIDSSNHFLVYLATAGRIVVHRVVKDQRYIMGVSNNIPFTLKGDSAQIMMIVQGVKMTFFVNGQEVFHASDNLLQSQAFKSGLLGYTLVSGTNKGYGTRCKMTNVKLWYIQ
jgi:hypothetical protein